MAIIKRRYVFFADLRGSTALYENLGNAQATSVVTEVIQRLSTRVTMAQGQVIKTLGDGLMAVFAKPLHAITAAVRMQDDLENLPRSTDASPLLRHSPRVHLQIAVTAGEVVEVGGDCFGDAVNVAARLLDHAGDSESLISREVFDELPWEVSSRFRHLDKVHLRGRAEPVEVFLLARNKGPDTEVTALEAHAMSSEAQGVQLVWNRQSHKFMRDRMPVIIGRSSHCTLKVDDSRVSRTHARIDLMGGALQLTDLSINGTFVRFAGDDEVLSLRRGSCTLHGQGELGLGGTPDDANAPTVHFGLIGEQDSSPSTLFSPPLFD